MWFGEEVDEIFVEQAAPMAGFVHGGVDIHFFDDLKRDCCLVGRAAYKAGWTGIDKCDLTARREILRLWEHVLAESANNTPRRCWEGAGSEDCILLWDASAGQEGYRVKMLAYSWRLLAEPERLYLDS